MNINSYEEQLGPNVTRYVVDAPLVAAHRKPGQFVIIRVSDRGERIPLTIADADAEMGTITLIVQAVGKTTREMAMLSPGTACTMSSDRWGSQHTSSATAQSCVSGVALAPHRCIRLRVQ